MGINTARQEINRLLAKAKLVAEKKKADADKYMEDIRKLDDKVAAFDKEEEDHDQECDEDKEKFFQQRDEKNNELQTCLAEAKAAEYMKNYFDGKIKNTKKPGDKSTTTLVTEEDIIQEELT